MEVSMSPSLTSQFESNAATNEKIVHDTIRLIGAGNYYELMTG